MERDALIAHGTSFLLQDRLMNCSDYSTGWVCRTCGSLISLGYDDVSLGEVLMGPTASAASLASRSTGEYCRVCRAVAEEEDQRARDAYGNGLNGSSKALYTPDIRVNIPNANLLGKGRKGGDMDVIAIPFVFKYLCAELASMGIAISVEVK